MPKRLVNTKWYSKEEAAALLSVNPKTIAAYIKNGELIVAKFYYSGKRWKWRIKGVAIKRFMKKYDM